MMQWLDGGVCTPKGFKAAGEHCGLRKNKAKKDIALVVADVDCAAAAVYTTNKTYGAPITVTREHLADGRARAIVVNSGNANTCNADGVEKANAICALVEKHTGVPQSDVVIASTGVIGLPILLEPFETGIPLVAKRLRADGDADAAQAIMTTDTVMKQAAVEVALGGAPCRIGAMCKGSGMIAPNMATMLCFVTTDAAISAGMLQSALRDVVGDTFNMVSIDGDTSTNDTLAILASGLAGNAEITDKNDDYQAFVAALYALCRKMAAMLAKDGEGATKLLTCCVSGAPDKQTAKIVAQSVVHSALFKAMMFGADANWGRVLCAVGYAQAEFDATKLTVTFSSGKGALKLCENSVGVPFSEEAAKEILSEGEITIAIDMCQGAGEATAWGCDLTYDYVKINGDYRS